MLEQETDFVRLMDDFLSEMGDRLPPSARNYFEQGGFRSVATTATAIDDPAKIDPVTQPEVALAYLRQFPKSSIDVAEHVTAVPLLRYMQDGGAAVPLQIKAMLPELNFYLLRFVIDSRPDDGEKYVELTFRGEYERASGAFTFSMVPSTALKESIAADANVQIGVDANLELQPITFEAGPVQAKGGAKTQIKGGFVWTFQAKLLKAKVVSSGIQSAFAEWVFHQPESLIGSTELAAIICAPKACRSIKVDMSGNFGVNVRGVWSWFKRPVYRIFRTPEPNVIMLPVDG